MKNNKISKISMVASLLVAGIVNAQEFYTCVPKKDWWKSTMKESIKEQKKEEWELLFKQNITYAGKGYRLQDLEMGDYKIKFVKNNKVIAIRELKASKTLEMYSSFWSCDCGDSSGCGYSAQNEEYVKGIVMLDGDKKTLYDCKGYSPMKFATIATSDPFLKIFGLATGQNNDHAAYFKDTYLEVWKKVED